MTIQRAIGVTPPLLALLAACDSSNPPSERLERAAEELFAEVEPQPLMLEQAAGPWVPRNECNDLPRATDFLASLQAAVDTRDADALAALAAEDVLLDFGGGAGRVLLRERLAENDGALWDNLAGTLELGCAAEDETGMVLPWYFAQDIPVDPYMGAIVTAEHVPLYNAPGSDADVVSRLSWDAVERLPSEVAGEGTEFVRWTDPESGDLIEGYIATEELRSIIDFRLIANRRNDRWRITALIAGD